MATLQKQRYPEPKNPPAQKRRKKQVRRRSRRTKPRFSFGSILFIAVLLLVAFQGGRLSNLSSDKTSYSVASRPTDLEAGSTVSIAASIEETQQPLSPPLQTETPSVTESPTLIPTPDSTPTPTPVSTPEPTPAPTDITARTLQVGDKGDDVLALQKRLATLGYLSSSDADGIYGNKTKNALAEYQKAAGLSASGVCDYDTYLSLTSSAAPAKKQQNKSSSGNSGPTVYVTRTGEKYHYAGCQYIKNKTDTRKLSKSEAIARGYTACSKCG